VLRGETIQGEDVQYRGRDGALRVLSLSGVPLRDATGTISGGITFYQDVTERYELGRHSFASLDALLHMAQAAVAPAGDARQTARAIAELTCEVLGCRRVGVMAVEADTQIVRALAVVGLSPEDERAWWAMQPEDAKYGAGADPDQLARFKAGEPLIIDMTQPPFDQQPNPFGITTALFLPMRFEGHVVGVLSLDHAGVRHDYTPQELALAQGVADLAALVVERERLIGARSAAEAQILALQEANRRMDEFIGIASHELRTPITSAKAGVEIIAKRLRQMVTSPDGATVEDIIARLARSADLLDSSSRALARLNRLVNDLLEASRARAKRLELQPAPFDLAALTAEVVAEHRTTWADRVIISELPARLPLVADSDRVRQVITNFLTNALKYAPPEESIQLRVMPDGVAVYVAVLDKGPGLTPEQQQRIWERFYRVTDIPQQQGSGLGLGLGLYISREIIERHGGRIGVTSEVGRGSTFWFTLPLAAQADA
jgi:signal transduction histidine kinase